ncbi:unnamed protein product [Pleuronectes platessa]|uniref:Retinal cone rhodopsin-sensitive cGMP 3',5'-cyclic phosphodiesterase subunit gamma n=1 Tax=Pleuronectes platessa TaxID=8262 RepID=A0A9N7UMD9_PLEPL|nr:unnamed protein product [Pleuronectes platessa]
MNANPPAGSALAPGATAGPHHTQEGAPQVQAEGGSYIQEQGPQARPEGVSTLQPHSHSHTLILTGVMWSLCPSSRVPSLFSSFGDDIPGMEGLGTDITVVCPWEAFGDMELSDLAKYGII